VERSTGAVSIVRVTAAVDCGQGVNPDGIRNQIEGGIVQSSSWTLYEKLLFTPQGVASVDWASYPIMRYSGLPQKIDVVLIDRPGAPCSAWPKRRRGRWPARLGNALADATGQRLFDLPLAGPHLRAEQLLDEGRKRPRLGAGFAAGGKHRPQVDGGSVQSASTRRTCPRPAPARTSTDATEAHVRQHGRAHAFRGGHACARAATSFLLAVALKQCARRCRDGCRGWRHARLDGCRGSPCATR
jgi:hypothetical protein